MRKNKGRFLFVLKMSDLGEEFAKICIQWLKKALVYMRFDCIPPKFSPFRNLKKNIGKLNSLTVRKKKKKKKKNRTTNPIFRFWSGEGNIKKKKILALCSSKYHSSVLLLPWHSFFLLSSSYNLIHPSFALFDYDLLWVDLLMICAKMVITSVITQESDTKILCKDLSVPVLNKLSTSIE